MAEQALITQRVAGSRSLIPSPSPKEKGICFIFEEMKYILNILYFLYCAISIIIAITLSFNGFIETNDLFLNRSTKEGISILTHQQEILFWIIPSLVYLLFLILLIIAISKLKKRKAITISSFIILFTILFLYIDNIITIHAP